MNRIGRAGWISLAIATFLGLCAGGMAWMEHSENKRLRAENLRLEALVPKDKITKDELIDELTRLAYLAHDRPEDEMRATGAILMSTSGCVKSDRAGAMCDYLMPFFLEEVNRMRKEREKKGRS